MLFLRKKTLKGAHRYFREVQPTSRGIADGYLLEAGNDRTDMSARNAECCSNRLLSTVGALYNQQETPSSRSGGDVQARWYCICDATCLYIQKATMLNP
jgi:hypothetical protein